MIFVHLFKFIPSFKVDTNEVGLIVLYLMNKNGRTHIQKDTKSTMKIEARMKKKFLLIDSLSLMFLQLI